jgi:cell division transport system permease protein
MLFRGKSGLPLARDTSARYLPWLLAFMVYLAALALAAAMMMQQLAERWERDLTGQLTIQLLPASDLQAGSEDERRAAVLAVLRSTPEVATFEILDREAGLRLLEPWLGRSAAIAELPLPELIAVTLAPGQGGIPPGLAQRLEHAAPGTLVDDHQARLGGLLELVRTVEAVAYLVVVLVVLVTVLVTVFVARTGLAIHHRVIELLHLIGAQDSYIARQFQSHALWLGILGGLPGLALAAGTLHLLGRALAAQPATLLPSLQFAPGHWLVLGLVPLVCALIAMLTARWTVLRLLARMP